MLVKRTDLALEARELWQESAERTTRLSGVKATKTKREGYPVTRVDILDQRGEKALGKPRHLLPAALPQDCREKSHHIRHSLTALLSRSYTVEN